MPATQATSIAQRREMMHLVEEGHTYATVAERIGISFWTVRKWIRQGKRCGIEKLASCYGRPTTGPLAGFDPLVRYVSLRMKRQHPKWGAAYVVKKMGKRPSLRDKKLPSSTAIWRYWHSFGNRVLLQRDPSKSKISPSDKPHGVWQMDAKESMQIPGVGIVSFNQARDEFGRVTVMHRVHAEPERARKMARMTGEMVFQDCRIAFTQWGMPEAIQTDRDTIYVDSGQSPFPNRIVLWWVGLGIEHRLIPRRTPKRNGTVERSHRTLLERTLENQEFADAEDLQKQVDADWHEPTMNVHLELEAAKENHPWRPIPNCYLRSDLIALSGSLNFSISNAWIPTWLISLGAALALLWANYACAKSATAWAMLGPIKMFP